MGSHLQRPHGSCSRRGAANGAGGSPRAVSPRHGGGRSGKVRHPLPSYTLPEGAGRAAGTVRKRGRRRLPQRAGWGSNFNRFHLLPVGAGLPRGGAPAGDRRGKRGSPRPPQCRGGHGVAGGAGSLCRPCGGVSQGGHLSPKWGDRLSTHRPWVAWMVANVRLGAGPEGRGAVAPRPSGPAPRQTASRPSRLRCHRSHLVTMILGRHTH